MRDPARIDRMLKLLREYWLSHPDLRLAQIVVNAVPRTDWSCPQVFYAEDDVIEAALRKAVECKPDHEV
ncbi:MAG: hypothetical protein K2P78_09990 [Gemmataceae bacterium]|nr:hypothetical protein [Gemmataceae bacterium]